MNITCDGELYMYSKRCDFVCPPGNYTIVEVSGAKPYLYGGDPYHEQTEILSNNFTCHKNFSIAMIYLNGIARFLANQMGTFDEHLLGNGPITEEKIYQYVSPIFFAGIAITTFYIISCIGSLTIHRLYRCKS